MRIHRLRRSASFISAVVNCFQYTNFSEDSQVPFLNPLISKVVNCFQYTNFSEDSQVPELINTFEVSCELLSVY